MSDIIASLRVALGLDSAQFTSGAARARSASKGMRTGILSDFSALKAGISGFVSALAIGTIVAAGKSALEYASHLTELAETLGLTSKDLQTFSFAAGQVGVSQEALEQGIQKLTISMGKAQLGSEAQVKAFNAIGISLDDLKGKDAGDVFRLMAEKLQNVSDRSKRAAVEVALFGKAGTKLDNLLSGAEGKLSELSDAAEKLGIVLSDEQIRNSDATADKLHALSTVLKAQIAGVVADNASSILTLANSLVSLVGTIPAAIRGWARLSAALSVPLHLNENPLTTMSRAMRASDFHDRIMGLAPAGGAPKAKIGSGNIGQFLGGGGGHHGGGGAGHAAEDLERKQLDALRRAYDYSRSELDAQKNILEAKKDLSTDYHEQTSLQVEILNLEREQYKADLDNQVAENKITKGKEGISQAQADQLLAQYDIADSYKRQKVMADEQEQRLRDVAMLQDHDIDRKKELLQGQLDIATTQAERRQIELELLKLAYEQKRLALQDIIDHGKDDAAKEDARRDLLNLNKNYASDRKGVMNQTAGPLEQWAKTVPQTRAQITEALQGIEADGLDGIAGAISGIVSGTESMGEAFSQVAKQMVAEITAVIIKMLILKAIQAATGMGGGGLGGSSPVDIGSSALTAGSSGVDPGMLAGLPGFAAGGAFSIMGKMGSDRNVLSLNGLPIARVSHGERLSIGNDNSPMGGGAVHIHVNGPMSDSQARRTGMQVAGGYQSEMARARQKGIS